MNSLGVVFLCRISGRSGIQPPSTIYPRFEPRPNQDDGLPTRIEPRRDRTGGDGLVNAQQLHRQHPPAHAGSVPEGRGVLTAEDPDVHQRLGKAVTSLAMTRVAPSASLSWARTVTMFRLGVFTEMDSTAIRP